VIDPLLPCAGPPGQAACRFPDGLACRDDTRSADFGGRPAALASAAIRRGFVARSGRSIFPARSIG